MKKVTLQKLSINNFKGIKSLDIDFDGQSYDIYGDNAVGKTTVYDSLYWLLFDKDSSGNKDFDIKPLDASGNVENHGAVSSVSATLNIDGDDINLEKKYYEKWTQQRGAADKIFSGNTADYYCDEVPLKKSEYESKISEIVSEDIFKLLTNLRFFNETLKWIDRRKVLFNICNIRDDTELMDLNAKFEPLKNAVGKNSLDEFKKRLDSSRKNYSADKNRLPSRIDENLDIVNRNSIDNPQMLQATKEALQATLSETELALKLSSEPDAAKNIMNDIAAIHNEIIRLENENTAFRNKQTLTENPLITMKSDRDKIAVTLRQIQTEYSLLTARENEINTNLTNLRQNFDTVSKSKFKVKEPCPMCGRPYDAASQANAKKAFEADVNSKLDKISDDGKRYKDLLNDVLPKIKDARDRLNAETAKLAEIDLKIKSYQTPTNVIQDMPDFNAKMAKFKANETAKNNELSDINSGNQTVVENYRSTINQIKERISGIDADLTKNEMAKTAKHRITELQMEEKNLAQKIADIDKLIFLSEEFLKFKVSFVEDSINGKFKITKFKLYNVQNNGGIEDCCEATYNGIPYSKNLNNGAKINVCLDIIQTLSDYYNFKVPLFIDNAESVTNIYNVDTQMILLNVSKYDKKLRCEVHGINS